MAALQAPCATLSRLSIAAPSSRSAPSSAAASSANSSHVAAAASRLGSNGFLSNPLTLSVRRYGGIRATPTPSLLVTARAPAAPKETVKKKEKSAEKRDRIAEQRRIYNKSRKTEIKTRMKRVFLALDSLKKSGSNNPEEIKPIEVLISQAYKIIDRSVKVGTLHRNTGGNRKSRLARAKRTVEIQLGWYTPTPTPST